jgi:hypothetical protein
MAGAPERFSPSMSTVSDPETPAGIDCEQGWALNHKVTTVRSVGILSAVGSDE